MLARGKGVEVRQSQLDEAFTSFRATLAARGDTLPEERRTAQEAQLLERLIITQLLTNLVTQSDRTNAQALAEKYIAETRKNLSDDSFHRQLKALGLTPDVLRRVGFTVPRVGPVQWKYVIVVGLLTGAAIYHFVGRRNTPTAPEPLPEGAAAANGGAA